MSKQMNDNKVVEAVYIQPAIDWSRGEGRSMSALEVYRDWQVRLREKSKTFKVRSVQHIETGLFVTYES